MNVLALCAGAGGLELGIRIAHPGAHGVCYVERDAHPAAVLAARMADGSLRPAPIWSDLATFDARPWRGVVDCVASGDPCQPNTTAGLKRGANDERFLIDQVLRIVEECRPNRFFRENVPGNIAGQLAALVPGLWRLGYRVAAGVFSAAETGGAHGRSRLFIMADAIGARNTSGLPAATGGQERHPDQPHDGGGGLDALPLLAPPAGSEEWSRILDASLGLEPALRRMAHGSSDRVDQVRTVGNAVSPLAAAYAWSSLDALLASGAS